MDFVKGEGPKLGSLDMAQLSQAKLLPHLQPVFTAIKQIRSALADDKALIGFSGAPWTLACYMIEGQGSREFQIAPQYAASEPQKFAQLMDVLCDSIIDYGCAQIEVGIDVFQLFDSWAGVVPAAQFEDFVITPTKRIVAGIKAKYPNTPIIGFAKGAGANLAAYASQTGVDALGIDQQMPLQMAKEMRSGCVLQGNIDNVTLASSKQMSIVAAKQILESWGDIPFIFNLGHGFLPHTPIEHVEAVVEQIKGFKRDV